MQFYPSRKPLLQIEKSQGLFTYVECGDWIVQDASDYLKVYGNFNFTFNYRYLDGGQIE